MKYDERACKFNMDTGCVELRLQDGRKNRDCATSFLEIYVQLYDFEGFCGQMK